MKKTKTLFVMLFAFLALIKTTQSQNAEPFVIPAYADPIIIGTLAAENLASKGTEDYMWAKEDGEIRDLHYAERNTAFAALSFARVTENDSLFQDLYLRYQDYMSDVSLFFRDKQRARYTTAHILLEFYKHYNDPKYLNEAMKRAQYYWDEWEKLVYPDSPANPSMPDGAFSVPLIEKEYYMLATDSTVKAAHADRAARFLYEYINLFQLDNGLYEHQQGNNFIWGRGSGWLIQPLAEGLEIIPETHGLYKELMASYQKHMQALLTYQSDNGMWYNVVDRPGVANNFEETSGTGMFLHPMLIGIKNGWLDDDTFRPAALKAWMALCENTTNNGLLMNCYSGTWPSSDVNAYLNVDKYKTGDMHGQSPLIWCAEAMTEFGYVIETPSVCNGSISFFDKEIQQAEIEWSSGVIDISCATNVTISMDIEGLYPSTMETKDTLKIYYKVDGGAEQYLANKTDGFALETVSASEITGANLELFIYAINSASNEIYKISNITISDGVVSCEKENLNEEIQIYPNPAESTVAISNVNHSEFIRLYDLSGRLRMEKIALEKEIELNIADLKNGLYVLKIGNVASKLCVKR